MKLKLFLFLQAAITLMACSGTNHINEEPPAPKPKPQTTFVIESGHVTNVDNNLTVSHEEAVLVFTVSNQVKCDFTLTGTNEWVQVAEAPQGTFRMTISKNTLETERSVVFTLTNKEDAAKTVEYSIKQTGSLTPIVGIEVAPEVGQLAVSGAYEIVYKGGDIKFTATNSATTICTVEYTDGIDWITTVETPEDVTDNVVTNIFTLTLAKNEVETTSRTAVVTFANKENSAMKVTYTITQLPAKESTVAVEVDSKVGALNPSGAYEIFYRGGDIIFTATNDTTTVCTIAYTNGAGWITNVETPESESDGIYTNIFTLTLAKNEIETTSRSVVVTFANKANPEIKASYTITQLPANTPTITVAVDQAVGSVNNLDIAIKSTGGNIVITATNDTTTVCAIAYTNGTGWITKTETPESESDGIYTNKFTLAVAQNTDIAASRVATMTLSNKANSAIKTVYTITQAPSLPYVLLDDGNYWSVGALAWTAEKGIHIPIPQSEYAPAGYPTNSVEYLYFKHGSNVGISGGPNGTAFNASKVVFNPENVTITDWASVPYLASGDWGSDPSNSNDGLGDPCKELGPEWSVPHSDIMGGKYAGDGLFSKNATSASRSTGYEGRWIGVRNGSVSLDYSMVILCLGSIDENTEKMTVNGQTGNYRTKDGRNYQLTLSTVTSAINQRDKATPIRCVREAPAAP